MRRIHRRAVRPATLLECCQDSTPSSPCCPGFANGQRAGRLPTCAQVPRPYPPFPTFPLGDNHGSLPQGPNSQDYLNGQSTTQR